MGRTPKIEIEWRAFSLHDWKRQRFSRDNEKFLDEASGVYIWQARRLTYASPIAPIEHIYVGQAHRASNKSFRRRTAEHLDTELGRKLQRWWDMFYQRSSFWVGINETNLVKMYAGHVRLPRTMSPQRHPLVLDSIERWYIRKLKPVHNKNDLRDNTIPLTLDVVGYGSLPPDGAVDALLSPLWDETEEFRIRAGRGDRGLDY